MNTVRKILQQWSYLRKSAHLEKCGIYWMRYCKLTLMLLNFYSSVIEYIGQPRDIKIMPEKQLAFLKRIVRDFTLIHNMWKWGKVDGGALMGVWPYRSHWGLRSSASLLGTTHGCNGRIQEKQLEKKPNNQRCWCYADVHSKQAANQKIYFLCGKWIDQDTDNLGTRLQT